MIITALRTMFNFYAFFIPVNSGELTRIIPQCSEIIFLFLLNVFSYYCGRHFCIYRHYFSQSGVPICIYEGDYLCVVSCSNDIWRCEMNWSLHLVSHFIHKCTKVYILLCIYIYLLLGFRLLIILLSVTLFK